jgi:hypothetical protein
VKLRFRVRFRETNKGRDGGLGPVKSYKCFASSADGAKRKLRKKGRIISIRKIPNG